MNITVIEVKRDGKWGTLASYGIQHEYNVAVNVLKLLKRTFRVYATTVNETLFAQYRVQ